MKKTLALLLALVMLLAFATACDNKPKDSSPPPANNSSNPPPASSSPPAPAPSTPVVEDTGPIDNVFTGEIGLYNPDYDYNANQRYKVVYLCANNTSGLYTESDKSFKHWASKMNVDYAGMIDTAGDTDAFFSQLPQLARDYDGIVMDADSTTYDRVYDIMKDTGTPWMSFMAEPRDFSLDGNPMLNAYVGFNQYDVGYFFGEYLYNKAKTTWPDVPISEFGFIVVDYSPVPALHDREVGAHARIMELDPDMGTNRYFSADTSTVGLFTSDVSQQVVNTVLSMNTGITHWLIYGEIDDMALGAAAALDLMGYAEDYWVKAFGGTALQQQWDTGRQSAWRSAMFLPQSIYTEPIFGALYAFMNGDATPETIYPEWIDANEVTTFGAFPKRLLPYYEILFDTYQHVLKWSDIYAGSDIFPTYPADGITRNAYSTTVPVPAKYK